MKWRDGDKQYRYVRGSYTVATITGHRHHFKWQLAVDHTIFGITEDLNSAKRRAENAFDDWCLMLYLLKKEDHHVVATTDKAGRQVLVEGQQYTRRPGSSSYEPDLRFEAPINLGDIERDHEGTGQQRSDVLDRHQGKPKAFEFKPRRSRSDA